MLISQRNNWQALLSEAWDRVRDLSQKIKNLIEQINTGDHSFNEPKEIANYIELTIELKNAVMRLLSWVSVIVDLTREQISSPREYLFTEIVDLIQEALPDVEGILDSVLTLLPEEPMFGIVLTPDQKQISSTRATISDVLSKIEQIKEENKEAEKDWGAVEQNAYKRLLEGSHDKVSGEEFLNWLSEFEQGNEL